MEFDIKKLIAVGFSQRNNSAQKLVALAKNRALRFG